MAAKKPFVVITSINRPTLAVEKFSKWRGWHVVVVGDRKTPADWNYANVTYLGIDRQYDEFGAIARAIPENTYTRKMLGYVFAIHNGATSIFETDDDNIPYDRAPHVLEGDVHSTDRSSGERLSSDNGWVNIYKRFGADACWPRGFPLEFIRSPTSNGKVGTGTAPWAVTQFLADEDPDVDAIYRMVSGAPVYFAQEKSYVLDAGIYCPFNSQATLWLPEAFPLLFFPLHISDRVTDILRGFMALACLWKAGYSLRFCSPLVYQQRNEHILSKDFAQEIDLYTKAVPWRRTLQTIEGKTMQALMKSAIQKLIEMQTLSEKNMRAYDEFLSSSNLAAPA